MIFRYLKFSTDYYWEKRVIWWAIEKDSSHVKKTIVDWIFEEAFEKWAAVTPLDFIRAEPNQEVCAPIEPINSSTVLKS